MTLALRDPWRFVSLAVVGLIGLIVLALALSPAVQAADQAIQEGAPAVAQENDDEDDDAVAEDDDAVTEDDDNGVVEDDDETPAPAETGSAGVLGGDHGGQNGVPQQENDDENGDNGVTEDDDDAMADDDAVTEDDDEETPAPAETGSAGLLGSSSGAGTSAGLFLLIAGGALALLAGARYAVSRR